MRSSRQLRALAAPTKRPKEIIRKSITPSDFARIYHSRERVKFVRSLPCAACLITGYSVNAHLLGNDGMSRKNGYETIGPLCETIVGRLGCHTLYDRYRWEFDDRFPTFDRVAVCARTECQWQASADGRASLVALTTDREAANGR